MKLITSIALLTLAVLLTSSVAQAGGKCDILLPPPAPHYLAAKCGADQTPCNILLPAVPKYFLTADCVVGVFPQLNPEKPLFTADKIKEIEAAEERMYSECVEYKKETGKECEWAE